jgi:hypothetical protein
LILISLPIFLWKKYINRKITREIPKSRITHAPNRSTPDQVIGMNDVGSIEMMNFAESFQERIPDKPQIRPITTFAFNTTKYNKNLISFSGISILILLLVLLGVFAVGSRSSWISHIQGQIYVYINFCCLPIILPTIYFIRKPNHLIVAMKDLNLC